MSGLSDQGPVKKASSVNGDIRRTPTHFDPRALLDPRRFAKRPASEGGDGESNRAEIQFTPRSGNVSRNVPRAALAATEPKSANGAGHETPGMGGFLEKMHGVSNREDQPQKRQKRDHQTEDGDEVATHATYSGGGKGGVIGEYMKQKKEEGKREAASAGTFVDLTGGELSIVPFT